MHGIVGLMSGRLGASVMAVRNGVQIARRYNPYPENPKSAAQAEVRAKFKMLGQLGKLLQDQIAIPKVGLVSSRNRFLKINYPAVTYENDTAAIVDSAIQLTDGMVPLGGIVVVRQENNIVARLSEHRPAGYFSRVVYAFWSLKGDQMVYQGSSVATAPGSNTYWNVTHENIEGKVLILAYGMNDKTAVARETFSNIETPTAEAIARVIASRTITVADVDFTTTSGFVMEPAALSMGMDDERKKK